MIVDELCNNNYAQSLQIQKEKIMEDAQRTFLDLVSRKAGEFQKALDKLSAEEKKKLLLTPLSEEVRENTLSYIIADRYADKQEWRISFLTTELNEIEKLDIPAAERLAVLTGANELGQTLFHKALKKGTDKEIFNILEARLRKWGGDDYTDAFFQRLRDEPLGTIDDNVSKLLEAIQCDIMPWLLYGSENYQCLGSVALNNYQPATYKGLKATIDKLRPLLMKHTVDNPSDRPGGSYQKKNNLIRAFAKNADSVRQEPTGLDIEIKPRDNKPNQAKPPLTQKP
jgi:hypothetical protein